MMLGFIDAVVDLSIDKAVVHAIEESPFKRLTVREIGKEVQFDEGVIQHLEEMRSRGLIMYISGHIDMDTEVALACG